MKNEDRRIRENPGEFTMYIENQPAVFVTSGQVCCISVYIYTLHIIGDEIFNFSFLTNDRTSTGTVYLAPE